MSEQSGQKAARRAELLAARAAYGALDAASAAVSARLRSLRDLDTAAVVLGYAATSRELSIDGALQFWLDHGRTVCLPWVNGADLGVAAISNLSTAVVPGWREVREPRTPRTVVAPERLDALIVPGLGFDRFGNRLGYGGGHFDRLLATVRTDAIVVGVALDEQVVTAIPTEQHDRPVDIVVTPSRTLRCG